MFLLLMIYFNIYGAIYSLLKNKAKNETLALYSLINGILLIRSHSICVVLRLENTNFAHSHEFHTCKLNIFCNINTMNIHFKFYVYNLLKLRSTITKKHLNKFRF